MARKTRRKNLWKIWKRRRLDGGVMGKWWHTICSRSTCSPLKEIPHQEKLPRKIRKIFETFNFVKRGGNFEKYQMPPKLSLKEILKLSMKISNSSKIPTKWKEFQTEIPNERNVETSGEIWQNREFSHWHPNLRNRKSSHGKPKRENSRPIILLLVSIGYF